MLLRQEDCCLAIWLTQLLSHYSEGIDVAVIVHGDEALLQVDEYLRNKFRINFVSLAGPQHEKDIEFLKRVITYGTDGWT